MHRGSLTRVSLWIVLASFAILLSGFSGLAAAQQKQPAKAAAKQAKQTKQPRGRLPNYFKDVVSEEQRGKIYAIQAEYREKLAPLKAQIVALIKEQNEKITALLTAEQLQKIEQVKAEALAKRKNAAKKKPAPKPAAGK